VQAFTQHLFTLRDNALDAAEDARGRLIRLLLQDDVQLAPTMAEFAHLQGYARWWIGVANHIEHGGLDPITALTRSRTAARRVLLDQITPRTDCPFTYGQHVAALEATRHFYHDTSALEVDALPRAGHTPPADGHPTTPIAGYTAITTRESI
jgi:hypothetical protein